MIDPSTTGVAIFRIAPTLEIVGGTRPGRPQRCTKGHRWNLGFDFVGVELDLTSFGMTEGPERFCALCLHDMLRAHCGHVEDMPYDKSGE